MTKELLLVAPENSACSVYQDLSSWAALLEFLLVESGWVCWEWEVFCQIFLLVSTIEIRIISAKWGISIWWNPITSTLRKEKEIRKVSYDSLPHSCPSPLPWWWIPLEEGLSTSLLMATGLSMEERGDLFQVNERFTTSALYPWLWEVMKPYLVSIGDCGCSGLMFPPCMEVMKGPLLSANAA